MNQADNSSVRPQSAPAPPAMRRELGVLGATMMGMGSIVGTGVFVSIGIAAGVAGSGVILAIALAALLAMCNAFSSAQLAASHPVSGGTYEYGYRYLTPSLGFTAGWMFLCAKSASAATAALGFGGYLLHGLNLRTDRWLVPLAVGAVLVLVFITTAGIRRASWANALIVSITLAALVVFVLAGSSSVQRENLLPLLGDGEPGGHTFGGVLHATALMFVAYTGYGRIATLGEEVHDPRRSIPRAIVATLVLSAALYIAVSIVAVGTIGARPLSETAQRQAAPLEIVAQQFQWPAVSAAITIGAITAMLGVLLNLILGLSRVLLAMGRRGDMPALTARIDGRRGTPVVATILTGVAIAGLAATGSVKVTWSFSAFTVLVYYAITNLAALRLTKEQRLFPTLFPWLGLVGCLALAFRVEWQIWAAGLALVAVGLIWHGIARHRPRQVVAADAEHAGSNSDVR